MVKINDNLGKQICPRCGKAISDMRRHKRKGCRVKMLDLYPSRRKLTLPKIASHRQ